MPELRQSIDVAGEILPEVAQEVGVASGTPVVIGGGDGACAAAGAGVIAEGAAYNYVGSSSWIALATKNPVYDPDCRTFTFGHIVPGMFMPTGTMQSAGASYQWARDQLCALERQAAETLAVSPYELMNLSAAGEAGVSMEDARSVLIAVAPIVGTARVVAASGSIAKAFGFALALDESTVSSHA